MSWRILISRLTTERAIICLENLMIAVKSEVKPFVNGMNTLDSIGLVRKRSWVFII